MNSMETQISTILVVDDDPTNLGVLVEYLNEVHFNVLVARNGESALEQIAHKTPDLILLDVMMPPGIDGFETCRRLKDNAQTRDIPVIFMTALVDAENKIKGFGVGGVDYITKPLAEKEVLARVKTHLTLWQQHQQLQQLNADKDKFFSIIAHDLRSPLSSLRVLTQLAADQFDTFSPAKLKEVLALQQKSLDNLCNLLENLLTWARIQRGLIEYHPQPILLDNVIMQNVDLLTPHARQKQITLRISSPDRIVVAADPQMLDAIVRNLLSNAVKFTHPGGLVEICVRQTETTVEVAVADTGIGIEAHNLPKLFQIQTKYKQLGTAREPGTGLGLILCKEFVEKHGGVIRVASEAGQGATFTVTLPKTPV